jgi:DNA-binding winged helix-turn-helix (wHTH) protein/tetratricopeptide (TPR) repeat protein
MEPTDRVDLAHIPGFALGRLTVRPAFRELLRDDGRSEVLQHRVMQVLIALARADGGIVTRDQLTMSCWDGRVVGEDAINRILSRLRAAAAGIGAGSFRIETITRVGYRLLREGQETPDVATATDAAPAPRPSRRRVLAGGAAALAAAAAGGYFLWPRGAGAGEGPLPPEVAAPMTNAMVALRQATAAGNSEAIGLLRRVVELRPDYADGWGALALAYAWASSGRGPRADASMEVRARAAMERAVALDGHNGYVALARAQLLPRLGHWREREPILREAARYNPGNDLVQQALGWVLVDVGRCREAVEPFAHAVALESATPNNHYSYVMGLWSANRLEEAERALDEGMRLFPSHFALWFARFYVLLYTGRAGEAAAFAENRPGRPAGIPGEEIDDVAGEARAMVSGRRAELDAAMARALEKAHHAAGHCENAILFACAVGRLDDAFALAEGLYFGRGFDPGELRYSEVQGTYIRRGDRRTSLLFFPVAAPMRADPRFARLVEQIGLTRYWAESGTRPDYRAA